MKKFFIGFFVLAVIILIFGYNIEYDAKMTGKELIEYFSEKNDYNDDLIVDLLNNSKINNVYCRKSNKKSVPPYFFVNKILILELDTQFFANNNSTGFDRVDSQEAFGFQDMKSELSKVIEEKKLMWCKPALSDNIEWYETISYYDDLCIKSSTYVYFGVDNSANKVYLISYQTP